MFAASKTDSVSGAAPDGQFNYVTMLLHGDGTNGAQNNTFLDSSTNNFTITRNGNTTQGSFSPYGSNWSNYFDGSSYLSIADSSSFALGTNNFTIEGWVYATGTTGGLEFIIGQNSGSASTSSFDIRLSNGQIQAKLYYDVSTVSINTSSNLRNAWNHFAFVRNGSDLILYVNGTSVGTNTIGSNSVTNSATDMQIGTVLSGSYIYTGYLSNLRIVNGTAVYTSAFTPPTTSLTAITNTALLTCQSNRFIDNSTNNFSSTITGSPSVQRFNPFGTSTAYSTSVIGGSGYFDGSGDTLTTSTSQIIPTGSFTVECWAYVTGSGNNQKFVAQGTSGTAGRFSLGIEGGNWWVQLGSDSIQTGTPIRNQWNHVAATFNGILLTLYINGVSIGTVASIANAQNTTMTIGQDWLGYIITGYVADVRISNTVRTISVPTAPFSSDGSTRLLLSMTNAAIFDNAMMNDLETVDNAQISTSVKKYGTGSLAFDGSDWLKAPNSPNFDMGAGNFTIEGWFYQLGTGGQICCKYEASYQASWAIGFDGSNWDVYTYYGSTSNLPIYTGVAAPSLNTWNHFALERNGSNIEFYLNGSRVAQVAAQTMRTTTSAVAIGNLGQGYDSYFNGYIDDLRITKGYARYSGTTYTMPTTAFSDTGPY